jgi:diguanylate cyclase (GGDEF)-like protein
LQTNDLTLLYVEDDEYIQEQMYMLLEDDFKEVYQAYNGEEGLEIYKSKNPDIVITDINMPKMDGLSMAKYIKEIDKEQPIIVLSAYDDRDTLFNALNVGINYFTPKPLDIDDLNDKISQVVEIIKSRKNNLKEQKSIYDKLHNLAHMDHLTKIPNRLFFDSFLDNMLQSNKTFALYFIDLDNFKSINDNFGHLAGDKVLVNSVKNIKKVISEDDMLFRISGDEFALIVFEDTSINHLNFLAQNIIEAGLKNSFVLDDKKLINITFSIGISLYPKDAISKSKLLRYADEAMYNAKKKGKSRYEFYS